MSGSNASNLGYGGTKPFSNVDGGYANKTNSQYSGSFGSNEIPKGGNQGLYGVVDNIVAASGLVNSLNFFKGGGRRRKLLRNKIKNITKRYKGGYRKMKSRVRRRFTRKSRSRSRGKTRSLRYYGGAPYHQYQSNEALSYGYRTGGPMPIDAGKNIALANPPLIHRYIGGKRRSRRRSLSRKLRGGAYGSLGVPAAQYGSCNGCYDFYNHYKGACVK